MCSVHIGQAYRDKPPEKLFNYFVLVIVEIVVANPISMNIALLQGQNKSNFKIVNNESSVVVP